MKVQCHRSRRTKDIWMRRSFGAGALRPRTNRRLVRQAVARRFDQDSARKSSRSFLPAAFGLLRIVRRPYLTISEDKAKDIHKLYIIHNKQLISDNSPSVKNQQPARRKLKCPTFVIRRRPIEIRRGAPLP